jgi:hypothetical protein
LKRPALGDQKYDFDSRIGPDEAAQALRTWAAFEISSVIDQIAACG